MLHLASVIEKKFQYQLITIEMNSCF